MRLFKTIAMALLFLGCSIRNDIEPLQVYTNPAIENGLQLTIGLPENFNEGTDLLPISFTNLTNDSLNLGEFFLISTDFIDNHSLELFIFNQDAVHYRSRIVGSTRCYGPFPQPFSLPLGKSYDKVLGLSFEFEYGLETDKVYDAYLVYRSSNPESHNSDQNNTQQEWRGSIKSNTVRFKYKSVLKLDLLEDLLQALFDE